jgi:hypothetical protein
MIGSLPTRREFLQRASLSGVALGLALRASAAEPQPKVDAPTLTVIAGKPRERGRQYGGKFRDGIRAFLDREIYRAFLDKPASKDDMLSYAGACAGTVRTYSPVIHDELEGMAEGSGLSLEELVLITLHEELFHRGPLPKHGHCTAVAVGPPDVADGRTYVGQTWDWMESVAGVSSVLHWKRPEGPSLLAYAYPGLWVGAGLNSAGLALCWTSAALGNKALTARVGIPSYVLLTHLLYQETLRDAVAEAKRATHAGWFTFVLADGRGNLVNIEGSPQDLAVEEHRGRLARVDYGSRPMTGTAEREKVRLHPRCQKMYDLLAEASGKTDLAALQHFLEDPRCGICGGKGTIDLMIFDTTRREAYVSRGPSYGVAWKRFRFDNRPTGP